MSMVHHYVITENYGEYLDLLALVKKRLDVSILDRPIYPPRAKFFIRSVMFEKARIRQGLHAWYGMASRANISDTRDIEEPREWSLRRLVSYCLFHTYLPFKEVPAVPLGNKSEYSGLYLPISDCLQGHGDCTNAHNALRGRMKECMRWLSDDDPPNDIQAFSMHFKTFLLAKDCDEDLAAALYLVKAWNRGTTDRTSARGTLPPKLPEALAKMPVATNPLRQNRRSVL
ncbi:hypothetical protein BBP40_008904 [Aspergillus hancockii]|nr:hypothetical protein BBP40_008904 [Aspergillus hancockii]